MVISTQQMSNRIDYAQKLYTERDGVVTDMTNLFKQEYPEVEGAVPAWGQKVSDFLKMVAPGRAQAIVNKVLAYMLHGPPPRVEVPPLKNTTVREDKKLTTLERYLKSLLGEADFQSHSSWVHNYGWWSLVGGMGTLKTLYIPSLKDDGEFPIRFFTPDPREVFPVHSGFRVIYVVERYQRHVMAIRDELTMLAEKRGDTALTMPSFNDSGGKELNPTDLVWVEEYWDDEYKGLRVNEQWVWNRKHEYPCIPYAFSAGVPTPLNDEAWRYRPYLASSANALKNEAYLLSMLQTGVEFYFWPWILVKSEDGTITTYRTGPGEIAQAHPESTIEVLNPVPAIGVLQASLNSFVSEVERNTLPQMMWSQPTSPARSGYAEEVRFAGTETDLRYMSKRLAAGLAHALSNVLKITEAFAGEDGFSTYSMNEGTSRRELLTIKADDIGGRHEVRVEMNPTLPRDMMKQVQMNKFLSEPDPVTREPMLPQRYRDTEILRVNDPTLIEDQRLEDLIKSHPKVIQHREQQALEEYKKRQGISDKDWEELGQPPPREEMPPPEQLDLAIPPAAGGILGPGAAAGNGETPWGVAPETLPPEVGGLGRSQQLSPEENAALAALATGRPPEGV